MNYAEMFATAGTELQAILKDGEVEMAEKGFTQEDLMAGIALAAARFPFIEDMVQEASEAYRDWRVAQEQPAAAGVAEDAVEEYKANANAAMSE